MIASAVDGRTCVHGWRGYERRLPSFTQMVREAAFPLQSFPLTGVGIGDVVCDEFDFAFSSHNVRCMEVLLPDYIFNAWPEVGQYEFDANNEYVARVGETPPARNKCGWAGSRTHEQRRIMLDIMAQHPETFETFIPGDVTNDASRMSFRDQILQWSCLVDVRGNGYSGRIPTLFHTGRAVLFVERVVRSWAGNMLNTSDNHRSFAPFQPFVHFVPVKADMSDLVEKATWLTTHPTEAAAIGHAGQALARQYFTHANAVEVIRQAFVDKADALTSLTLVGQGYCRGDHYWDSASNKRYMLAGGLGEYPDPDFGGRYESWLTTAVRVCRARGPVTYVSVWNDAGVRCYQGVTTCAHRTNVAPDPLVRTYAVAR